LDGEDDDFGDFVTPPPLQRVKPNLQMLEDDELISVKLTDRRPRIKAGGRTGDFSDFSEASSRLLQPPAPTPSHQDS
jgi:hypothetical protein